MNISIPTIAWNKKENVYSTTIPENVSPVLSLSSAPQGTRFLLPWVALQVAFAGLWLFLLLGGQAIHLISVPLGFVLLTGTNVWLHRRFLHAQAFLDLQICLGVGFIIILHFLLGGFIASGYLLVGLLLPLLGQALLGVGSAKWMFFYSLMIFLAMAVESLLQPMAAAHTFVALPFHQLLTINLLTTSVFSIVLLTLHQKMQSTCKASMLHLQSKVEEQNELLKAQLQFTERQRVDQDSALRYAQRIQKAVTPQAHELCEFFAEGFVYSKPRNHVSGDFFWCSNQPNHYVLVVADCTGHGTSGAFLTMLGSSILNQLVNETGIVNPAHLLRSLDMRLASYLHQGKQDQGAVVNDGMDVAVMVIEKGTNILTYAGAKQSLWHVHNDTVQEIKGDKIPIGHSQHYGLKRFVNHTVALNKGDKLFVSTDGFKDQFGGTDNRKYGKKEWGQLLTQTKNAEMEATARVVDHTFTTWKGDNKQTDDVLVVGVTL